MTVGGNRAYAHEVGLPSLVRAAVAVAERMGFDHSCAPAQGRLLALLAGGRSGQRIGETGTGCGVGLAWMVEATEPDTELISIELDEERAAASFELFRHLPNVLVLQGDWRALAEHGPFDLLVLDGGGKGKDPSVDEPIDPAGGWLSVGGTVVLDDFIPRGEAGSAAHDAARHHWLSHPAMKTTELRLGAGLATLVGQRLS